MVKDRDGHSEKDNVIPFANNFNYISTLDLDNIMEWLEDHNYLSEKGITFKIRFWALFIKSKIDKPFKHFRAIPTGPLHTNTNAKNPFLDKS